jgi:hypothetical protein
MLVQQPADWRARLAGLADQWLETAGQEALCGSVSADDVETSPKWAVEGGGDQGAATGDTGNCFRAFRLHCSEALDRP